MDSRRFLSFPKSKKSAIWTSLSNFLLSLYLPLNFNKDIPHFQFVNSFNWFNSDNLKFTLGVDGISMPFIVLSTFLILLCVIYIYPQKKKNMRMYLASFIMLESFLIGTFSAIDLFSFYIFFESIFSSIANLSVFCSERSLDKLDFLIKPFIFSESLTVRPFSLISEIIPVILDFIGLDKI